MTAEPHELPVIACTLGSGELAEQEQRWAELVRTAGTGRRATADGIELRFQRTPPSTTNCAGWLLRNVSAAPGRAGRSAAMTAIW